MEQARQREVRELCRTFVREWIDLALTLSPSLFCRSATAIGQALHNNRILTYLDCSFNPFGDEGNQVIARALEDNTVCQDSNRKPLLIRSFAYVLTWKSRRRTPASVKEN